MRNASRWMPALVLSAGLAFAGGAAAQKQPDPPPAAGGKGGPAGVPQSQKLHLTPPPPLGGAPQPRQAQPAPRPPQPQQGARPGTGPQASQKLHLTPPPPIGRAPQAPPQQARPAPVRPPAQPGAGPQPSQKLHLTPPSIPPQQRGPRPGSRPPNEREAQRQAPPAPNPAWPALPPRMAEEPAALVRLRALLTDEVTLGYREARQDGEVLTLVDADVRRGNTRFLVEELILDTPSSEGLRRGEARNIRFETPDSTSLLAQIEIGGLAMLALRPGQTADEREPDQIALDLVRLVGLSVEERSGTRVNLGRFELSGWRAGQAGQASLEQLVVGLAGMPVDQVRVASAGVEGLDLAALMTSAVRNETPSRPPEGRQSYRVEGLQVLRGGQGVAGMGRLLIEGEARADGFSGGRIALTDVVVERTEETGVVLDVVGLERLSMDLTIDASWTPANERLDVTALAFGVRELGALALGWSVEGVNIEAPAANPEAVRLLQAQLRYADESLYERTLADQARRQNQTPAQIRAQHREILEGGLTGPAPDPGLDGLREALVRFVAGEAREVEIVARPPAPVTLGAAQEAMERGPGAAIALLGIRATAR